VNKFCELTDELTVGQARIEELQRKQERDLKTYKEQGNDVEYYKTYFNKYFDSTMRCMRSSTSSRSSTSTR
jgi:hypothetical protein